MSNQSAAVPTPTEYDPAPWAVRVGDCRELMAAMPAESVDAIVTDPPYEIAFMGKGWDQAGVAFDPETWRAAYRVLKPGGHLLAFGAARTYHRIACAIEDAGFEVRDTIAWMYGSGFPKSHNVSKAIDKLDAANERRRRDLAFTAWMRSTGVTASELGVAIGNSKLAGHYRETSQPLVPTAAHFDMLRPLLTARGVAVPSEIETLVAERIVESENYKRREVVGSSTNGIAGGTGEHAGSADAYGFGAEFDLTAPATPEAQRWAGWGTALKPAYEPIIVARKPLTGTVAANVLAHGTGALNIDGCLIGSAGRWPANVILDDVAGAMLDAQTGSGASRFFYCAKASGKERDAGLDAFDETGNGASGRASSMSEGRDTRRRNTHPTVKPIALMRYLCRLVTPPGGLVLDPFAGSGSTGCAAVGEGLRFLGMDQSDEFAAIARGRIAHWEALRGD